jgi:septum formation protein
MPELILASTSPYRRALLDRLGLSCRVVAPQVDETPLPGEAPVALAARLAAAKALRVLAGHPGAVVIGADQVADLAGAVINKPEQHAAAVAQLRRLSGQQAVFHSALCVAGGDPVRQHTEVISTVVQYRQLDDTQIERYLAREPAYDCAGSAKIEGLGIALVESVRSDDPSALIGLPLIATLRLLQRFGIQVP